MSLYRNLFRSTPAWGCLASYDFQLASINTSLCMRSRDCTERHRFAAAALPPTSCSSLALALPLREVTWSFNTFATTPLRSMGTQASESHRGSKRIEHSPVSRAIALLVSQDNLPRDRLVTFMSALCSEMVADIKQYNTTEVAAFCEAAKKMDFCTQALADAVMEYLPGRVDELCGEELPGLLWVVSKKDDLEPALATELCEAVHNHLDELRLEDLPGLIPIVATMCPASPFLLTSLADQVMVQLKSFSASELTALVESFGCESLRRSLYDDSIFKGLAAAISDRVEEFSQTQLRQILAVYRDICSRHHTLLATLSRMEAELVPLCSPTPQ